MSEREETERIVREAGAQALRKLDGMTEAERNEYYDDIKQNGVKVRKSFGPFSWTVRISLAEFEERCKRIFREVMYAETV